MTGDAMIERKGLQIAASLAALVEDDILPGTGIAPDHFWGGLARLAARFTGRNRELLAERERLQAEIDSWFAAQARGTQMPESVLRDIGYLVDEPAPFTIGTSNADAEIATMFGPQLVVPVLNARFLLNAANARWGSLYDALYGTDALDGSQPPAGPLDSARAAKVVAWGRDFLDEVAPLADGSWHSWQGGMPVLADTSQPVGWAGDNILLRHNGLHIEILVDRAHPVGRTDPAGVADILLEAALTTIVDFEDSVAAVDAEDKVAAYRNWLGLMRGDLQASFIKGGHEMTRALEEDRIYSGRDGQELVLPGRSVLLVRNVGHLMTNPAIRLPDGSEIPEGIMDAAITSAIALHDLRGIGRFRNSRAGSVYIVKPKMHGPAECAFTNDLFDAVEDMLGLARHTIKVGVMDEERRTSANLAACIHAVKDRIFFINTGFLDRTGDEIHTAMEAGPVLRKGDIKQTGWIAAYEDRNVQIGLACGFAGRAQIGKGMWPAPDRMQQMLTEKIGHPMSAASTAWVPSPTAAVLHATHYHRCDVAERQRLRAAEPVEGLDRLLTAPLAPAADWSAEDIRAEVDNNVQGLLGYVVRWIDMGVGCSKVPDISDVGLMEDRATLRISSQHLANWLRHGVIDESMLDAALERMAKVVDAQNAGDPSYRPMAGRNDPCLPLEAARALVVEGTKQPSGYTEPLLHAFRQRAKLSSRG
nr:malate synthase G [Alteraurantiacibacter aquimixticola]